MTDRPQITLSWMRDQDGVIVVYATDADGQKCAVADFWARPLRENLGLERGQAKALQQQLAERLVDSWNGNHRRISTAADAALLISRLPYASVQEALHAAGGEEGEDAVIAFLDALRDTRDLARADGGSGQSGAGAPTTPPHKSNERTSLIDDPTVTRQAGERPASSLPEDA